MLCVTGLLLASVLIFVVWLLMFTVSEARRQRRRRREKKETQGEGGTALQLARELQDRSEDYVGHLSSDNPHFSLYLTDEMLFDHARFRSQYERIPDDYPDAFTINRAKILEENRLVDYFSESREVDCLIRNLFRRCYSLVDTCDRAHHCHPGDIGCLCGGRHSRVRSPCQPCPASTTSGWSTRTLSSGTFRKKT